MTIRELNEAEKVALSDIVATLHRMPGSGGMMPVFRIEPERPLGEALANIAKSLEILRGSLVEHFKHHNTSVEQLRDRHEEDAVLARILKRLTGVGG